MALTNAERQKRHREKVKEALRHAETPTKVRDVLRQALDASGLMARVVEHHTNRAVLTLAELMIGATDLTKLKRGGRAGPSSFDKF